MSDSIFAFFGLHENPFRINPDPRYLFQSPQVQTAWDELTYGIETRKGLLMLTGEVGTGKTLLLRRLLDWLAEHHMTTAYIFNSHLDIDHLLDLVLNDYGIPCHSSLKTEKLISLNRWLLDRYRAGDTPVLIVDEAQGLSWQVLEQIRLLLNLETPRQKLLQVVLAGQPELLEILRQPDLRQLRQRITIRCKTYPLTREQTQDYVNERLRIAGANGEPVFDQQARDAVHLYSGGVPRIINLLCEHALINACAANDKCVRLHAVRQAAGDCQLEPPSPLQLPDCDVLPDLASTHSRILASGATSVDSAVQPKDKTAAQAFAADSAAPSHQPVSIASVNAKIAEVSETQSCEVLANVAPQLAALAKRAVTHNATLSLQLSVPSANTATEQLEAISYNVSVSPVPTLRLPSPFSDSAFHPKSRANSGDKSRNVTGDSAVRIAAPLAGESVSLPEHFAGLRHAFLRTWQTVSSHAWKPALRWWQERFRSARTPALRRSGMINRDHSPSSFSLCISPRFRTRVSRTVAVFTRTSATWRSAHVKLLYSVSSLFKWFRQPLRHPRPRQTRYRPQIPRWRADRR
jgi:type II secretory pathway predicted ATPase ExeA